MASKTFKVPNITCGHCVMTIKREVGELEGVQAVKADETTKMVTVDWDASATDWDAVRSLLEEINYSPQE